MTTLTYSPTFSIPDDAAGLKTALQTAQSEYDAAKSAEIEAIKTTARVKEREADVWNGAYQRAAGSSQAAKKEAAELDEAWKEYVREKNDAADRQRDAERAHSITYQRLETLRSVAALLKPRIDEDTISKLTAERVLSDLRIQEEMTKRLLKGPVPGARTFAEAAPQFAAANPSTDPNDR